eukprot:3939656-Rhodomonas_salina.2
MTDGFKVPRGQLAWHVTSNLAPCKAGQNSHACSTPGTLGVAHWTIIGKLPGEYHKVPRLMPCQPA